MNSNLYRPLSKIHSLAVKCEHVISSRVVALFGLRHPLAVVWLVISVYILPLDGHAFTPRREHIIAKRCELLPSAAYFYSATTVGVIVDVPLVTASLFHSHPHPVERVLPFSGRATMNRFGLGCSFSLKAPAGAGVPEAQLRSRRDAFTTAITDAVPEQNCSALFVLPMREGLNCETIESTSCNIFHRSIKYASRFIVKSQFGI